MTNKISMVAVAQLMEMTQISQYLGKTFKQHKENNYMVTEEECVDFLKAQVLRKLKYADKAQELITSKKYLECTEVVDVAKTTKKAQIQKKGTITQLRMFLELKGLTDEFQKMLDNGELDAE